MKTMITCGVLLLGLFTVQCKKQNAVSPDPTETMEPEVIVSEDTVKNPVVEKEVFVRIDKGFERELIRLQIDQLGKADGKVRLSDIQDIETLTIRPQIREDIQTLKGIEHFVNLKSFTTLYTKPDSLDFSKNTKLEYLHVETGLDIAGERKTLKHMNLTQCKELKYLNCRENVLTSLNITQNHKLTTLICDGNYTLNSIDLSGNPELQVLRLPTHKEFKR